MTKKVVILGGGIAGMSAAHELIERGYQVSVYERRGVPGGKARSMEVPNSGTGGRKNLPGEHGFRFFPGFYKHITDTMKRTPYGTNRHGVYDNLVSAERDMLAGSFRVPVITVPHPPTSLGDLQFMLENYPASIAATGVSVDDMRFIGAKIWQLMTSCEERRVQEYERLGWWQFVDAAHRSEAYRTFIAVGPTRSFVASVAELASTKTIGDMFIQLLLNQVIPGETTDRLLVGPTNEIWLRPWLDYLRSKGVDYHFGATIQSIDCDGARVLSATVEENGNVHKVTGDHFIAALPVETMAQLLNPQLLTADPGLGNITELAKNVRWMNGIQFYFKNDVPITRGHEMMLDSKWALTGISQAQFWKDFPMSQYGDGTVGGVLSVDISDWTAPGIMHGAAQDCTKDQIAVEVWLQLKQALNVNGRVVLEDSNVHSWFIDEDIRPSSNPPHKEVNVEPLLVNLINTWPLRPRAYTQIPNFYLASDYVQTHTDLACMEGANEAARRAVNAILARDGSTQPYCEVWRLHEPEILAPLRIQDRYHFEQGLPWMSPTQLPLDWLRRSRAFIDQLLGV